MADLAAHPTNLRARVDDLDGMAKSITASGVIEPLVVVPQDCGCMRPRPAGPPLRRPRPSREA